MTTRPPHSTTRSTLPSRCNTRHNPLQPGPIFFKTPRKMQFFDVHAEGFSRQMNYLNDEAAYFRLLPRNSATQEGKRHVKTVPVKLTRAHNDKHSTHPDTLLARAPISNLEGLASLLGPQEVTFHSQDDKEVHTKLTYLPH